MHPEPQGFHQAKPSPVKQTSHQGFHSIQPLEHGHISQLGRYRAGHTGRAELRAPLPKQGQPTLQDGSQGGQRRELFCATPR